MNEVEKLYDKIAMKLEEYLQENSIYKPYFYKVDFETKKAEVIFDDAKQNEQSLRETVEKLAGGETYKVEQIQIQKVEEA